MKNVGLLVPADFSKTSFEEAKNILLKACPYIEQKNRWWILIIHPELAFFAGKVVGREEKIECIYCNELNPNSWRLSIATDNIIHASTGCDMS